MAGKAVSIETQALELAEKIAQQQNVYIVDVSYSGGILCYYIDKEGGVGIDDCEAFSRAVEPIIDEADPIDSEYSLEVSSPGVDRKLKKKREFLYYLGREVEVKLFAARDGIKEFDGILEDYYNKTAVIKTEKGNIELPIKDAAYIRLKFTF